MAGLLCLIEGGSVAKFENRPNRLELAIQPDTTVSAQTGSRDSTEGSTREKSQTALTLLELGDRVQVEFDRVESGQGLANFNTGEQTVKGLATPTRLGCNVYPIFA